MKRTAIALIAAALGCKLAGVRESASPGRAALIALYESADGANWRRDDLELPFCEP